MMRGDGGPGWIRTIEGVAGRFTVCSLWPLGHRPRVDERSARPVDGSRRYAEPCRPSTSSPRSTTKRSATPWTRPSASWPPGSTSRAPTPPSSRTDLTLTLRSATRTGCRAVRQVLEERLVKRDVSLKGLEYGKVEEAAGGTVRQVATLRVGISSDKAREINKLIKAMGLKGIQSQTQGDQVRVTGKKRDDLQAVIAELKEADLGVALQFTELPRLAGRALLGDPDLVERRPPGVALRRRLVESRRSSGRAALVGGRARSGPRTSKPLVAAAGSCRRARGGTRRPGSSGHSNGACPAAAAELVSAGTPSSSGDAQHQQRGVAEEHQTAAGPQQAGRLGDPAVRVAPDGGAVLARRRGRSVPDRNGARSASPWTSGKWRSSSSCSCRAVASCAGELSSPTTDAGAAPGQPRRHVGGAAAELDGSRARPTVGEQRGRSSIPYHTPGRAWRWPSCDGRPRRSRAATLVPTGTVAADVVGLGQQTSPPAGRPQPASADLVHHRGIGQRRGVAEVAALGHVAQQPAHDLAAAGLGQVGREDDRLGPGDGADLGRPRACAAPRRGASSASTPPRRVTKAMMAWPVDVVLGADHGGLGHRVVGDEGRLDLGGGDAVAGDVHHVVDAARAARGSRRRRAWPRRRRSSGRGSGSSTCRGSARGRRRCPAASTATAG